MSETEVSDEDFGEAGEAGEGGALVKRNPVGIYDGQRSDKNERHGRGRAELPNGDVYLGTYYKGQRHGLGIYRYKNGNGARYGGDWTYNDKKGWGTMYYPDGGQYTGRWDRNHRNGWGIYVYPNGDEYEGWWYYGRRNGRGIYRTKANGEKFVGEWRLGKRHGPGQLIRKEHRFIGNWYNDVPKGPGVYVFPDLQCEQHGRYTHMKIAAGGEDRWKLAGYQVRTIRTTPPFPLDDPHAMEKEHQSVLELRSMTEVAGEGRLEDLKVHHDSRLKSVAPIEERVFHYMMNILEQDALADEEKVAVVPMWRAIQITGLITKIPDETVPPPPLPPTPLPPPEPEKEDKKDEEAEKAAEEGAVDPIEEARRLAQTHALQDTYFGQGVCQPDTVKVKLPPEVEPYSNFSAMSLSNIDEMRAKVEAMGGQMGPLDIEAAMRVNEAMMKGHGLEVADKWRNCLGDDDPNCEFPEAPAPPGGTDEEQAVVRQGGGQHHQQGHSTEPGAETDQTDQLETSAYDENEESEAYNLTETEEEEGDTYTTDDY